MRSAGQNFFPEIVIVKTNNPKLSVEKVLRKTAVLWRQAISRLKQPWGLSTNKLSKQRTKSVNLGESLSHIYIRTAICMVMISFVFLSLLIFLFNDKTGHVGCLSIRFLFIIRQIY